MRVWFMTGAGRGLGLAFAAAALDAGDAVVATARDAGALEPLAHAGGDRVLARTSSSAQSTSAGPTMTCV